MRVPNLKFWSFSLRGGWKLVMHIAVYCGLEKGYAVCSANSRNEKYSGSNGGPGAHRSPGLSSCSCGARRRTAKPPGHHDAAVIGIKLASNGSESPRAYIIPRAGARLTEEQVMARAEERLAKYKRLEGGVKFIDSIPKNASGEILKNALREQATRELSAK